MEEIGESSSGLRSIDCIENGQMENSVSNGIENGLETINEQAESSTARSASEIANGGIIGDEKPELSDVFDMVCIDIYGQ